MLTEEEKKKIEQEELYRREVRSKKNTSPWWKPHGCWAWGCLVIVVFFVAGLLPSAVSTIISPTETKTESNNQAEERRKSAIEACMSVSGDTTMLDYCTCTADYIEVNYISKGIKKITSDENMKGIKSCIHLMPIK